MLKSPVFTRLCPKALNYMKSVYSGLNAYMDAVDAERSCFDSQEATELCCCINAKGQHKPTGLVSRVKVWPKTSKSSHRTLHQYTNSSLHVSAIVICSGNLPSLQKGKTERARERDRTSCITFLNKCQAYI